MDYQCVYAYTWMYVLSVLCSYFYFFELTTSPTCSYATDYFPLVNNKRFLFVGQLKVYLI